jgi:hypothetical protein
MSSPRRSQPSHRRAHTHTHTPQQSQRTITTHNHNARRTHANTRTRTHTHTHTHTHPTPRADRPPLAQPRSNGQELSPLVHRQAKSKKMKMRLPTKSCIFGRSPRQPVFLGDITWLCCWCLLLERSRRFLGLYAYHMLYRITQTVASQVARTSTTEQGPARSY